MRDLVIPGRNCWIWQRIATLVVDGLMLEDRDLAVSNDAKSENEESVGLYVSIHHLFTTLLNHDK